MGPEEEDGAGWGCLVPTKAEREEEKRRESQKADAAEAARLKALINAPELENFLRAVHIEAVHQVERWGTANDRAKRPADWFRLVGYLGGKALHAAIGGDRDKALHHCVSTAAALYNWHCSIRGIEVALAAATWPNWSMGSFLAKRRCEKTDLTSER